VQRAGPIIAVLVLLLAAAVGAGAPSTARAATGARVAPAAAIDLHWLVGDENEPDENERDDGGGDEPAQRSSAPLPRWALFAIAGVALVFAAAVTAFIVRWVRRYRAWKRRMAVRTHALTQRLADELDRAWRR
jgi:hypothetical protein